MIRTACIPDRTDRTVSAARATALFLFLLTVIPCIPVQAADDPGGGFLSLPPSSRPALTTAGAPADRAVTPTSFYDGVARVLITTPAGTVGCTGALLNSGLHVLTAAHCLTDDTGRLAVQSATASFFFSGGRQDVQGASYALPPGWNGDIGHGSDIALIRLSGRAGTRGYELFRDEAFIGGVADLAGYGDTGTGTTGSVEGSFGALRAGTNRLDTFWDIPGLPFAYDFDDGSAERDTIGNLFGVPDRGTGASEVMTAPGDSGAPAFIDFKIAGVHSFGATFGVPFDIDNELNDTFGELGGGTRVAPYASWVDGVVAAPEPGTFALCALGAIALISYYRRKSR